ncbi:hypothetical protein BX616_008214 [Lobosporangium transversale]|uniref:Uncharacterized protein n=1 Tax=Lobosporangium transversale TaxID=64571 RepID=A0A1Y2H0N6_9FUNG|nr:hypothetical protein BCR41DRAFT_391555 [Lobosporangium transversale]KAF9918513.1 hypothetical protein BX616_008214 [Lobosporangium transversale]ORZ28085.1 hypothetical protein BCR41DRAFT_391555 [Lobosporangium transversale]|eukprot:XP_021885770.1 hypothetical protein BCR41DRAFT_391555 [Lobosporangium transversale]
MLLLKSVVFACTATVVLAFGTNAIISIGNFVGEDTTDPSAKGEEIFSSPQNHAAAVASILSYISAFPGFRSDRLYHLPINLSGDRDQFHERIVNLYGLNGAQEVADAFLKLLPKKIDDKEAQSAEMWTLSQTLIQKDVGSDQVLAGLLEVTMTARVDDSGNFHFDEQEADFQMEIYRVDSSFLQTQAPTLARNMHTLSVKDVTMKLSTSGLISLNCEPAELLAAWLSAGDASRSSSHTHFRQQHAL